MIRADTTNLAALVRRLTSRARKAAEVRAENDVRERQRDPQRWRDARLLWPDTTRERR